MLKKLHYNIVLIFCLFLFIEYNTFAYELDKYQTLVEEVGKKLITAIDEDTLNLKYKFSPKFNTEESLQAGCIAEIDRTKSEYIITITTGMLKNVVKENENRLAYILAHELSHITCRHLDKKYFEESEKVNESLQLAFQREDEFEADRVGFKLMVSVGYSHKGAIEVFKAMRDLYGDYSSIEAVGKDHPSWTDRLAQLDKEKENIWRAMSSFNVGVDLLHFEQYEAAAVCFGKVTSEFPDAYEAFNNLGYAYLMKYFDAFDSEDIKQFNVGQVIAGGFYRRPASLEDKVKGVNEELWWKAVGSLREAIRINPNLSLAKANLGIAYLLDPRQQSRGESQKFFEDALAQVESDNTIDPLQKAVIYINAGNLGAANFNFELTAKHLDKASYYISIAEANTENNVNDNKNMSLAFGYDNAQLKEIISFNRYLVNTKGFSEVIDVKDAADFLKQYLRSIDKSSIWWKYAYDLYTNLCQRSGQKVLRETELISSVVLKPIKQIELEGGTTLFLSQKMNVVNSMIKYSEKIPIVKERKIYKYIYEDFGFEIVSGDEVIMIVIKNVKHLKNFNLYFLDGKSLHNSHYIGLSLNKLKEVLSKKNLRTIYFDGSDGINYLFCYEYGAAFSIEKGKVNGITLVEPPRLSY